LHKKEKVHNLYCSPDTVIVIKPRIIRWAGSVECMGAMRMRIFDEKNAMKRQLGKPHVWGRTLIKM
jgi:hypothetical protein